MEVLGEFLEFFWKVKLIVLMKNIALASIILATLSCNKTDKSSTNQTAAAEPVKIELPNTPETVVRTWEDAIGKNQFSVALMLSMGPEVDYVRALEESNNMDKIPNVHSEIVELKCQQVSETAICDCKIKYDDDVAAFKYYLIRNNGQWFLNDVVPSEVQPNSKRVNQKPSRVVQ